MTLEQRVEMLERQNRWFRRIGVTGVAFIAVVMLMGQGKGNSPQDLVVRSLNVRDETGRDRARLWLRPRHGPEAALSHKGEPTAVLGVTKDGRGLLMLTDSASRAQARLGVREDGAPRLELVDREGRVRTKFGLDESGSPSIVMLDSNDKVIWQAPKMQEEGK
ncbi:MAG: hypothetical protein ACYSX0_22355 [Planctomycetota bacterium]|jgi:hypothetical protein